MAKKRMFDQSIVESDVFLDMPLTSQTLYFHLCMNADDYGFVSPKRIMRMIGSSEDDIKILIGKRYVLVFDSGVVVIKHWLVNNTIRKDRSQVSSYQNEFKRLTKNEWGAYTEIDKITTKVEELTGTVAKKQTNGKPNDNHLATQNRIEEIRLDKISNTTNVVLAKKPLMKNYDIDEIFEVWKAELGYDIQSKKQKNRNACSNLLKKYGRDKLQQLIHGAALAQSTSYAPQIADFIGLQSKTNELIAWGKKQTQGNVEVIS
jgi:hypothetical protein